jgi:hypothetical protein
MHVIEVVEIQLLVVHCVEPIDIDADVLAGPKFVPDNVRIEPPVVGPFAVQRNVTAGAAASHQFVPQFTLDTNSNMHNDRHLLQEKQLQAHRRM